jgi:hypothetical protein
VTSAYIVDVEKQEERHMAEMDRKARESVETAASNAVAADRPAGGGASPKAPDQHAAASAPEIPDDERRVQSPGPETSDRAEPPPNMFQTGEGRWGSREAEITAVTLVGADGEPSRVFFSGERVEVRLKVHARQPLTDFVVGVGIFNIDGVCCYGTNTDIEELKADRLSGDAELTFAIDALELVQGTYKLDVAVHKVDGYPYDYHRLLYSFRVKSRTQDVGIYRPRHTWQFSGGISFTETVR